MSLASRLAFSRPSRRRKAGQLDRLGDPRRVDLRRRPEPLVGEQFRPVDVVRHERGVRGAAGKRDLVAGLVDHEFRPGVAIQNPAHEADVVQKTGADQMSVVFGHDPVGQHAPAQDVAADHRDQHRMFEIVVEGVAAGDALDGAAGQGAQTFGHFVMRRNRTCPGNRRQESSPASWPPWPRLCPPCKAPELRRPRDCHLGFPVPFVNLMQRKPER